MKSIAGFRYVCGHGVADRVCAGVDGGAVGGPADDELTAAGCLKVFVEQASGAVDRGPQLDPALGELQAGDTLVVWRLDRLGRSLRHLIEW